MQVLFLAAVIFFMGCASARDNVKKEEADYLTKQEFVESVKAMDKSITSYYNRLSDQVDKNTSTLNRREEECPCK